MKIKVIFAFILLSISFFSCKRELFTFNVNCDECHTVEPDSADLIVRITINEENEAVPLIFYKGKAENGIIEWVDTSYTTTLYLYSRVNEFYSVRAKYKKGDKTIYVIDGDKLITKLVSDVCERDCWIVKGGILDVQLK